MDFAQVFARCLLVLASFWLAPGGAVAAAPPVEFDAGTTRLSLDGRLEWWPEAPPAAGIDVVRAADAAFVRAPARASFGWRPEPTWFRVAVTNSAPRARSLVLEVAFANISELDLYVERRGKTVDTWYSGTTRRADTQRMLPSPRFAFPLDMAPGETATLYLRAASSVVLNLPLALYDEREYVDHLGSIRGWQGLFYGVVAGIMLCVMFLWRSTGDRTFLHYMLATLCALLFFLGMDGYLAYWMPTQAVWQPALMFFGACLSVTFTLTFARAFFNIQRLTSRMDGWLRGLGWVAGVASLLVFFVPVMLAMGLSMLCSMAMAVLLLIAALDALRVGFTPARLLLAAMAVHLVSVGLLSFSAIAEIPGLFTVADRFHRVGFMFLMVCVTVALGLRIRTMDQDRRRAEEIVLQTEADARARGEFQSRMSHELRTPMTGVLGMAELLESTALDVRQRRYLATLRYSGEILLNLINDMLDHARIEAGRLRLRREAFDLLRLVDECRMLFEQQPRDDGSLLRTDLATGSSRVLVGDGPRLRQVLVNVLMRAFRATDGRPVELRVQAMPAPGWLRFEIACAGVTGDEVEVDDGLATSRHLCAAMGGSLWVQATPEGGTLYRIDLPLNAAT